MSTVFLFTLVLFFFSFSVEVKQECYGVVENVLYCKSVITEKSLIPQVCGKCELEVRGGKLYISPAGGCPRYDALACQLRSGELFLINNLTCKPGSQEGRNLREESPQKGEMKVYRVKVMGDFCFNLLRKKFYVLREERDEALIKASPEDLKHLPHCVYTYEER